MKRFSLFFSVFTFVLVVAVNGSYAGAPKSAEPPQPSPLSGKVMESINGGGYTYVHIEKGGKKIWVAVPDEGGGGSGDVFSAWNDHEQFREQNV